MNYKDLLEKRFACKNFCLKPLKEEEENYILDCGRLTPSSFGLEAWHVYSVSRRISAPLFEDLYKACFSQYSVKSAAFITVLTYKRAESFKKGTDFLLSRAERFDGGIVAFEDDFRGFFEAIVEKDSWSKAQTYLLGMNMAMAGSSIGIESCILEGYKETEVAKILNIDLSKEGIGLVIPFGYPNEEMRGKLRIPLMEFSTTL